MLELKTKTYRKKIEIDPRIAGKFEHPIIFYLAHKDDPRPLFITFVILDFAKRELIYIFSYLPENIQKVEAYPDEKILKIVSTAYNPHCSIQITPEEDFYTFIENAYYFLYVNRKKNIMRIYTGKDFNCPGMNQLVEFGSTFYKDDEDAGSFYLTSVSREEGEMSLNFFKAKLDLSEMKNIFSTLLTDRPCPARYQKIQKLSAEFRIYAK